MVRWAVKCAESSSFAGIGVGLVLSACVESGSPVAAPSHGVLVPELGNGDAGLLTFDGPVVTRPAATGETVTLFVSEHDEYWSCPGERNDVPVLAREELAPGCRQLLPNQMATVSGLEVSTPSAGATVTSSDSSGAYSVAGRRLQVSSERAGHVDVLVTLTFTDGRSVEDSLGVDFVEPTRFAWMRDEQRGPGTRVPGLPGVAHAWCARVMGVLGDAELPLLVVPPGLRFNVEGVPATIARFTAIDEDGWVPAGPGLYDFPPETRGPHCAWLTPLAPGRGTLRAEQARLAARVDFETANPEDIVGFELHEAPDAASDEELASATHWVPLETPPVELQTPSLQRVELVLGAPKRWFAVFAKLADGGLAAGGRGALTLGPHGVVDLATALDDGPCVEPWGCWRFGFTTNGAGAATLSGQAPSGDAFEIPIEVLAAEASP